MAAPAPLAPDQVVLAFAPLLTMLRLEGDVAAARLWLERLLKWLAVGGVTIVAAVVLLGRDLVPFVLGRAYGPAAKELVDAVNEDVRTFCAPLLPHDDCTMIAVRRLGAT